MRLSLIFDTETTGLPFHPDARSSVQPRIIEYAGILVDQDGEVHDELSLLINPEQKLDPIINKITGIYDSMLKDEPTFAAVADQIRAQFAQADCLIAHNLPFDHNLISLDVERCAVNDWPWPVENRCTVQEHYEMFGYRIRMKDLYQYYTGEPLAQTHRAMDDTAALLEICIATGVLEA